MTPSTHSDGQNADAPDLGGVAERPAAFSSVWHDMWDKPLFMGDDVIVYLPTGDERDGRFLRPSRGRALVALDGGGSRLYPFGWLSAWGEN